MKMKEILTLLGGCLLCGAPQDDHEFTSAFASDMMSDVLAYGQGQSLLLTGLLNQQVIRTAEMLDMHCIIFVGAKPPPRRSSPWRGKKASPSSAPSAACSPPAACCMAPACAAYKGARHDTAISLHRPRR